MSQKPVGLEREGSLQDVLDTAVNPVRAFREIATVPPRAPARLVPEYTNWRSEQLAWNDTAVLMHDAEHMTNLFVSGADALAALARIAINKFGNFEPLQAKQFIACSHEGYLIGDGIVMYLEPESFVIVADPTVSKWIEYQLSLIEGDITVRADDPYHWYFPLREGDPSLYRFEVQGPTALDILEAASGAPVPETKFFHLTEFTIAGKRVSAVRHGMAGQPGFELFGPWEDREPVYNALLEAGEPHGMIEIGSIAYFMTNVESGWYAVMVPAIWEESSRGYREWLPAGFIDSLATVGSFDSENVQDYLATPFDVGYGRFIDFDRDFIGRAALEAMRDDSDRKDLEKVSFIWNEDDFAALAGDLVRPEHGLPPQYRPLHDTEYTMLGFDAVQIDGKTVGYITQSSYIPSERCFASIGLIAAEHSEPGTQATVIWGDSLAIPRSEIEPHRQVPVRVTITPAPLSTFAREQYRK